MIQIAGNVKKNKTLQNPEFHAVVKMYIAYNMKQQLLIIYYYMYYLYFHSITTV